MNSGDQNRGLLFKASVFFTDSHVVDALITAAGCSVYEWKNRFNCQRDMIICHPDVNEKPVVLFFGNRSQIPDNICEIALGKISKPYFPVDFFENATARPKLLKGRKSVKYTYTKLESGELLEEVYDIRPL